MLVVVLAIRWSRVKVPATKRQVSKLFATASAKFKACKRPLQVDCGDKNAQAMRRDGGTCPGSSSCFSPLDDLLIQILRCHRHMKLVLGVAWTCAQLVRSL